jgi:hypothetical protein
MAALTTGQKTAVGAGVIVVAGVVLQAASPVLMAFIERWESGSNRVLTVYADKLAGGLPLRTSDE